MVAARRRRRGVGRRRRATWIVGAAPGAAAQALAPRFGARQVGPDGTGGYVVAARARRARSRPRCGARPARVRAAGHARPGAPGRARTTRCRSRPDDWRAMVADPALTPPPVTPTSPLIALVDAQLDATHPEFAGGNTTTTPAVPGHDLARHRDRLGGGRARQRRRHRRRLAGRPRAQRAAARRDAITCSRSADGIGEAAQQRRRRDQHELRLARPLLPGVRRAPVRRRARDRAGRRRRQRVRTRATRSSSRPRCRTCSPSPPSAPTARARCFSNTNAAIDLSAPGEDVMTAVPPALDSDGAAGRLRGPERHELLGADGRRPRSPGSARRGRRSPATRSTRRSGCRRATSGSRAGSPTPASACCRSPARCRSRRRRRTPLEPNDDIVWVDGRAFGKPDRLFYKGSGTRASSACSTRSRIPATSTAIRLRPHSRVKVRAKPAEQRRRRAARLPPKAKRVRAQAAQEGVPLRRAGRSGSSCATAGRQAEDLLRGGRGAAAARDLDAVYALRVG